MVIYLKTMTLGFTTKSEQTFEIENEKIFVINR